MARHIATEQHFAASAAASCEPPFSTKCSMPWSTLPSHKLTFVVSAYDTEPTELLHKWCHSESAAKKYAVRRLQRTVGVESSLLASTKLAQP
jgi:hypothetical protein